MKLLSAQQIHEWDAFTIANEPVASIDLMERAARKCTDFLFDNNLAKQHVKIFCGKGNNGGDGLAIARQLCEAGITVIVYILEFGAKGTDDFQVNLHRLHDLDVEIIFLQTEESFPVLEQPDIVIDALFGSGLNRPLKELSAALVNHINAANATVVAIDVPSGMFIDKSSKDCAVIKATFTLTFQALKLCFLVAENETLCGKVSVLDIGLRMDFLASVEAPVLISKKNIQSVYKPRTAFSHKGKFGHALLVAGNTGKMGAALLAAKACLRTGVGLVTISAEEKNFPIIHTALPEAMCDERSAASDLTKYNVCGIGPGLGTFEAAIDLVKNMFEKFSKPFVIDADALNIIASNQELLNKIPAGSVITPHPKEFERLFGKSGNDFERIEKAIAVSKQYSFVVVLKGHYTLIASNGLANFNTTGNAGLAKGGSGDVLTGIITSLLAQGYNAAIAAIMGVYLHGLAADITAQTIALESMIASDMIDHISDAILSLQETVETSFG